MLAGNGETTSSPIEEIPMTPPRTLAAIALAIPLLLTGCSGDGDVDVNAPNVEVTPGDVDVDAPEVDAPDVDAPDVDAPDVDAPDVDVDADVEEEGDADEEAEESPSS